MQEAYSYKVELQIPDSFTGELFKFIDTKFLKPQVNRFTDISSTTEKDGYSLAYKVVDHSGVEMLRVQLSGGKPMSVTITPSLGAVSEPEVAKAKEDIDIAVDFFEAEVRKNTLFFAWREGESIVPEDPTGRQNKSIQRIIVETQIILIVIFMGARDDAKRLRLRPPTRAAASSYSPRACSSSSPTTRSSASSVTSSAT